MQGRRAFISSRLTGWRRFSRGRPVPVVIGVLSECSGHLWVYVGERISDVLRNLVTKLLLKTLHDFVARDATGQRAACSEQRTCWRGPARGGAALTKVVNLRQSERRPSPTSPMQLSSVRVRCVLWRCSSATGRKKPHSDRARTARALCGTASVYSFCIRFRPIAARTSTIGGRRVITATRTSSVSTNVPSGASRKPKSSRESTPLAPSRL